MTSRAASMFTPLVLPVYLIARVNHRERATGTAPSTQPPGWYADPWNRALYRYWDGYRWEERTRNDPVEPATRVLPPRN